MGLNITVLCTYGYILKCFSTNILQLCCFALDLDSLLFQSNAYRYFLGLLFYIRPGELFGPNEFLQIPACR
jgi:hypothetical protein